MSGTIIAAVLAAQLATTIALPNRPVSALDLTRYAGTWHEIARREMWFQRKCVADVTATYRLLPDNTISVTNRCRKADGEMSQASGVARRAGAAGTGLQVRFAPDWLAGLPLVWADYWVVDLDPNYQWALVGGPSRQYLWVLSRQPTMDPVTYQEILASARSRGYDVTGLVRSTREPQ